MSPEKFVEKVEWFLHHTQGFEMRSGLAALVEQYYAESEIPPAPVKPITYDLKEYPVEDTVSKYTYPAPLAC